MRRGTGRTTRMLEAAATEARAGSYCIVIAANKNQVEWLADQLSTMEGANRVGGDKVYFGAGSVSVAPLTPDFDLGRGQSPGAHSSVKSFIDHYAAEEAFRRTMPWAWNEWERFSEPQDDR